MTDTKRKVDADKAKLEALEALKQRLNEDVATLRQADGDRTPYGGDFESLVTAAQLASQQETDELLRRRLERRLSDIEKVSRRVEQGQYGVCESSGGEIPAERLAAVPDTTMCVPCQSKRERRGGIPARCLSTDPGAPPPRPGTRPPPPLLPGEGGLLLGAAKAQSSDRGGGAQAEAVHEQLDHLYVLRPHLRERGPHGAGFAVRTSPSPP